MVISRLPLPLSPAPGAAQAKGGATIIHTLGSSVPYPETTTPGEALLFRKGAHKWHPLRSHTHPTSKPHVSVKARVSVTNLQDALTDPAAHTDLEHEAEVLEAGEKHLLSLNLWAMRKRSSGQVLHVFFPVPVETSEEFVLAEGETAGVAHRTRKRVAKESAAGEAALLLASDAATSYAISVDDITSGMLHAHVEWHNRQAEEAGRTTDAVVRYECDGCSHAAFGTVFRIMARMHVSAEELHAHRAVIDFFFPVRCLLPRAPSHTHRTSLHAPPCE